MLPVKTWRTEAIVRLALGVAVCVFMGVLGMSVLRLAQPGAPVNLLLFGGVVATGLLSLTVALALTRQPFHLEGSPRRLMVFLASLYLGLALVWAAQTLTSPSARFSPDDFVDLPSFVERLKRSADPVSSYLKAELPDRTLGAIVNSPGPNPELALLKTALAQDLNKVIEKQPVYTPERFAGIVLRPETRRQLEQHPRGNALVRLNRLLLEDAYPLEIAREDSNARTQPGLWHMVIAGFSFQGAALVLIGFFLREHGLTWSESFGFDSGRSRAVCLGVFATMIVLPVAWLLQIGVATVLSRFHFDADPQTAVQLLHDAPTWLDRLPLAFVAIVLAPPAEEMLFRGLLYPAVKRAGFPRLALWGTTLLFAGIHWNILSFPSLVLLALVLTWLYEKTGNLLAPIAAHSLFNAFNFAALLFYERIPENLR